MPTSIQISSTVGFFFSPLWMCGGTLPTTPGRSPCAVCTTTCDAISSLRSTPPACPTRKNPLSSMWVTVRPISSMCASSSRCGRPSCGGITWQIRLFWMVRLHSPRFSHISWATASAWSSPPATPSTCVSCLSICIVCIKALPFLFCTDRCGRRCFPRIFYFTILFPFFHSFL